MLPHRTAARKEKHATASLCSTQHARSTPKKTTRSAQVSDHMQVEAAPQMGLDSGKHRRGRGTSAASLEATCVALISSHHPCCAACLLYGLKGAGGARGASRLVRGRRERTGAATRRRHTTSGAIAANGADGALRGILIIGAVRVPAGGARPHSGSALRAKGSAGAWVA